MTGHDWNAKHYDSKLGFVSELGRDLVSLLQPKEGERILDLGCGTGDLSYEISTYDASVLGIDLSKSMIEQAREKFPGLQFSVEDAQDFQVDSQVDAVFSNAALHWMKQPSKVIRCVWEALLPGGRFVAEFGGKGNVETVISALETAVEEAGMAAKERNPWYFPSIAEYATLLETQGFRTSYALHFDRPTEMHDGDKGLEHWLNGFAASYLNGLDQATRSRVVQRVTERTRPVLFGDGKWVIDYKRLRIVAIKPR